MWQVSRTVSIVELIWTAISLMGLGFSIFAFKDAIKDRRTAARVEDLNEYDEVLVNMGVRNERSRLLLFVGFAAIGKASLFLPNVDPEDDPLRLAIAAVFVSLNAMLASNCWKDRQDRKRLLSGKLEQGERASEGERAPQADYSS